MREDLLPSIVHHKIFTMNLDTVEIYTLEDIKEDFPEVWKLYESVEKFKREQISCSLLTATTDFSKKSFLNNCIKSIYAEINSSIIFSSVFQVINGKVSMVLEAIKGQLGILAIHEVDNPSFQKLYSLITSFTENAEQEFKKEEVEIGFILDYIDQLVSLVPEEEREKILGSEVFLELDKLTKIDPVNDRRLAMSYLLHVYYAKDRIEWIKEKIKNIEIGINKRLPANNDQLGEYMSIEGGLTKNQIDKAFDFLCEAKFQGKTLLSKKSVSILKQISLCLPKEGYIKNSPKFRLNDISNAKEIMYAFMHELWHSHVYYLKSTKQEFYLFLSIYFEDFPDKKSIETQMKKADERTLIKIRKYLPDRASVHV